MTKLILPTSARPQSPAQPTDVDHAELRRLAEEMRVNHRLVKQRHITSLEGIFQQLQEGDLPPGMTAVKTAIKAHPGDIMLRDLGVMDVQMMLVAEGFERTADGSPHRDLVFYRTLDRQVAFGLWDGQYLPQRVAATCTTMRPMRFVEFILGDDPSHPELGKRYEQMETIIVHMGALVAMRDAATQAALDTSETTVVEENVEAPAT